MSAVPVRMDGSGVLHMSQMILGKILQFQLYQMTSAKQVKYPK